LPSAATIIDTNSNTLVQSGACNRSSRIEPTATICTSPRTMPVMFLVDLSALRPLQSVALQIQRLIVS
jgi:hypothetical protein